MHVRSIKCPECNSSLNVNIQEGQHECYCQYCGAKITLDDHISNHVYRKVDEARIKEAEIRKEINIKKAENDKEIRMKELEIEDRRAKASIVRVIAKLIGFLAILLIATLFSILPAYNRKWDNLDSVGGLVLFVTPFIFALLCWSEKK